MVATTIFHFKEKTCLKEEEEAIKHKSLDISRRKILKTPMQQIIKGSS